MRPWPPEYEALLERIAASGAVLSEFPLDAPPHKSNFPRRNRLISGLSMAVVVVEAYPEGARDTSDAGADRAARRAEKVKEIFSKGGIAADLITAAAGDPTGRAPGARDQVEVTVRRKSNRPPSNPNAPKTDESAPETP